MSTKARQYTSPPSTRAVTKPAAKGHATAEARKRARQKYGRSQGLPWLGIGAGVVGALLIAVLAFVFTTTGTGKLSAQSTNYAFGDVPWRGGYVYTKFPLSVEGDSTVNEIQST